MKKKLGLALAGGGIKGFCHVGVLEALEEAGLTASAISGTSMGAVIAALYASGYTPSEILEMTLEVEARFVGATALGRHLMEATYSKGGRLFSEGLFRGDVIEQSVENWCSWKGVKTLRQTKLPLAISAVDINTGKLVLFVSDITRFPKNDRCMYIDDVPIGLAVRASTAYPMVFHPRGHGELRLVDGGVLMNTPVWPLQFLGADQTVAITMDTTFMENFPISNRIPDILSRTLDIMQRPVTARASAQADYALNVDLPDVEVFEVGKGRYAYEQGLKKTKQSTDELKRALARHRLWRARNTEIY